MTPDFAHNVGALVEGGPNAARWLVAHAEVLAAYADGEQPEREAYLSHFVFGPEMRRHYAATGNSVAGFAGPSGCRWLVFDIDRADLAAAPADARRLVTAIVDRYPELDGDVPVYFSGNKGFHVLLPLAHRPPPSAGFPRHARAFAELHAADAGVAIDAGIYDINRIVRLPNTRHPKTGRFKRRLDARELIALDAAAVLKLAESPAGHGLPAWDAVVPAKLAGDWDAAGRAVAAHVELRREARRDAGPADSRAPKFFLDFLRFGVETGERHAVLFRSAAWMAEQGAPESLCLAMLTEPGRDVGLTPAEVDRQIRCGVRHARRQRPDETDFPFGALAPTPTDATEGGAPMTPKFVTGADLFGAWLADVTGGTPPARYAVPAPFGCLDVRPGRLVLLGGPPGGGKTAALLQIGIDLLRGNEAAKLLVANVEMTPTLLTERIVSRLSGVPLTAIADRALTADQAERLGFAVAALAPAAGRLAFLEAPYTLEHVAAAADAFGAGVLVLDYVQRFAVGGKGADTKREELDSVVALMRKFCDEGAAVLVAAAVARQTGKTGSNYSNLTLASFRGSSELEYGCDSAFVLVADGAGGVNFQCEKNRYGPTDDIPTRFDPTTQTFTPAPSGIEAFGTVPAAPPRKPPKGGTPCGS